MEGLESNTKLERVVIEKTESITKARLKEYISTPLKDIALVVSFINTLQKGMEPMSRELVMYEVALKQLVFPRALNLKSIYEIWGAYFQDKVEGRI
jgi:hypothetical protein